MAAGLFTAVRARPLPLSLLAGGLVEALAGVGAGAAAWLMVGRNISSWIVGRKASAVEGILLRSLGVRVVGIIISWVTSLSSMVSSSMSKTVVS